MKKYSVLLMYPSNDNDGHETYYDHVEANSPDEAALIARQNAIDHNGWGPSDENDGLPQHVIEDFPVLLVIEGEHLDLYDHNR